MTINRMQIIEHKEAVPGIRRMVLSGTLKARPGQFVQVSVTDTLDPLLRRPLSIHNCADDRIDLLYRICGRGTRLLAEKKAGETLNVLGPLGNGFPITEHNEAVLVAGGIGIAPLYYLGRRLASAGKKVHLCAGAKTGSELYLPPAPPEFAATVRLATDDGSVGHHGLVTELVTDVLNETAGPVYCCGPLSMMREVTRLAAGRAVYVSLEAQMACGVGACQGCVTPARAELPDYWRVCTEGPVFRGEEVFF